LLEGQHQEVRLRNLPEQAVKPLVGISLGKSYQSVKSMDRDHGRSCPLVGSSISRVSCSPSLHGHCSVSSLLWELCRLRGIPALTRLPIPSDFSGSCLRICPMDVGPSFTCVSATQICRDQGSGYRTAPRPSANRSP